MKKPEAARVLARYFLKNGCSGLGVTHFCPTCRKLERAARVIVPKRKRGGES